MHCRPVQYWSSIGMYAQFSHTCKKNRTQNRFCGNRACCRFTINAACILRRLRGKQNMYCINDENFQHTKINVQTLHRIACSRYSIIALYVCDKRCSFTCILFCMRFNIEWHTQSICDFNYEFDCILWNLPTFWPPNSIDISKKLPLFKSNWIL